VILGGRRVRVRRPRVRSADGSRELPVPTYQAFAATDLLGQLALERMLSKLSCRRYPAGLEPVGAVAHYNEHRPHRALGQASPLTAVPLTTPTADMRVVRVDRLGGLIHEYAQVA
jgi:hypothetical protein